MDGLQLHFDPKEPFQGHIYVKGKFADEHCHLDFTNNRTTGPFNVNFFNVHGCFIKCEQVVFILDYTRRL